MVVLAVQHIFKSEEQLMEFVKLVEMQEEKTVLCLNTEPEEDGAVWLESVVLG